MKFATVFFLLWIISWGVIFGGEKLPFAPEGQDYLIGEIVTFVYALVLIWLTRKTAFQPAMLGIRRPGHEALLLTVYLVAFTLVLPWLFGVRSHLASLGIAEQNAGVWAMQTSGSVLRWALINFAIFAAIPFLVFRYYFRYPLRSFMLGFSRRWIPYALITGTLSLGAFVTADFFQTPIQGHLITLVVMSLGTFIPVMIFTQSLLAPRFALLTKSWIGGAILTGLVYGVYHFNEFYLSWDSGSAIAVSLAWAMQSAFFGVIKGITTLRTGNAWLHIFNTHTPHLAEAPEIHRIFNSR